MSKNAGQEGVKLHLNCDEQGAGTNNCSAKEETGAMGAELGGMDRYLCCGENEKRRGTD